MKERVRAEAQFKERAGHGGVRAEVPAAVREHLGSRAGDVIVFAEGCESAKQEAALRGDYFVVWVERAKGQERPAAKEEAADEQTTPPQPLESFAEAVRRRRQEGGAR